MASSTAVCESAATRSAAAFEISRCKEATSSSKHLQRCCRSPFSLSQTASSLHLSLPQADGVVLRFSRGLFLLKPTNLCSEPREIPYSQNHNNRVWQFHKEDFGMCLWTFCVVPYCRLCCYFCALIDSNDCVSFSPLMLHPEFFRLSLIATRSRARRFFQGQQLPRLAQSHAEIPVYITILEAQAGTDTH